MAGTRCAPAAAQWDREVPGPGMEVGRECLADAVKGTSTFGQRDHLAGNAGFVTHCSFPRMTVSTMPAFDSLLTFTVCYGLCQAGSLLEDVLLFVGCVAYRGGCRAAVICRPPGASAAASGRSFASRSAGGFFGRLLFFLPRAIFYFNGQSAIRMRQNLCAPAL